VTYGARRCHRKGNLLHAAGHGGAGRWPRQIACQKVEPSDLATWGGCAGERGGGGGDGKGGGGGLFAGFTRLLALVQFVGAKTQLQNGGRGPPARPGLFAGCSLLLALVQFVGAKTHFQFCGRAPPAPPPPSPPRVVQFGYKANKSNGTFPRSLPLIPLHCICGIPQARGVANFIRWSSPLRGRHRTMAANPVICLGSNRAHTETTVRGQCLGPRPGGWRYG
jgi:hypothetical protein